MAAALVFHGLCLNVVKNDGTCELVIPHTRMAGMQDDMHRYEIKSPADTQWTPFDKTFPDYAMTLGGLVSSGNNPMTFAYTAQPKDYFSHQFTLNGRNLKLTRSKDHVRNQLILPWPDKILGANRFKVKPAALTTTDGALITSPVINRKYIFPETAIFYYDKVDHFRITVAGTSFDATQAPNGVWVLSILSWPKMPGSDHGTSVNQMLELKNSGRHPDIHFTGLNNSDAKPATVSDFDETADQVLPPAMADVSAIARRERGQALAGKVVPAITSETGCSMLSMTEP